MDLTQELRNYETFGGIEALKLLDEEVKCHAIAVLTAITQLGDLVDTPEFKEYHIEKIKVVPSKNSAGYKYLDFALYHGDRTQAIYLLICMEAIPIH